MNRLSRIVPAALALAFALTACESSGGGNGGGGGDGDGRRPGIVGTGDRDGQMLSASGQDVARVVRIDKTALQQEGKVRYWIENVSGRDQEDLVWSCSFAFPPDEVASQIESPESLETSSERSLVLFKNDKEKMLEAVCPNFQGKAGTVKGTKLNLAIEPAVATTARSGGLEGTRFFGGRVECVGMASQDEMNAFPPRLWLEFENIGDKKVSDLEVQVVFTDTKARTKWKPLPSMAPKARGRVEVDLTGLDMGSKDFLVKVRQASL